MSQDNPPQDPQCFGEYEVMRDERGGAMVLGSGSYGRTYKARHLLLGNEVAIKVIRRELTASEGTRQRFLREGRALAGFAHDHIAMLRHFGRSESGQLYYAMDYCGGGTLAERVQRLGPRPLGEALEILRQATSALAAAHAAGIIHRDLKPGNIMLTQAPPPLRVKVIDFGLAMSSDTGATSGRFHGTAQWASPEQLREQTLDGRSDLFSLGLVLWFLLQGTAPDLGTTAEVVQCRLAPGGYADRLPQGLPPDVGALLGQLLEIDPQHRPAAAAVLLDEINALRATYPYHAVAEPHATAAQPADSRALDLPCLSGAAAGEDRYERLTRLHRDHAGEWFETELADGRGSRIVFVLDEAWAGKPALCAKVRANLARLWRHPLEGLPRFTGLQESDNRLVAEFEGTSGDDMVSWLRLRTKVKLSDAFSFLARVAEAADETAACGVPGLGLMAAQVRRESSGSSEGGSGLRGAVPRLFPLLLDASDVPAGEDLLADAIGSTLVLASPDLACDRIFMLAKLIYRMVSGRETPDAVAHSQGAYVAVSALSEQGNAVLCMALARNRPWDSCLALLQALAAAENLALETSGSGRSGSSRGSPASLVRMTPPQVPPAPVQAHPVVQAPPSAAAAAQVLDKRLPAAWWGLLGLLALAALAGGMVRGCNHKQHHASPSVPSVPSVPSPVTKPPVATRIIPATKDQPFVNGLGMKFVPVAITDGPGAGQQLLFSIWETRVKDFQAFCDDSQHDAIADGPNGALAFTLEKGGVVKRANGSWRNPRFSPDYDQTAEHPVVCVSYIDAEAFCTWLTQHDRTVLPVAWRYRLPTDAEWSAACGPEVFPWGASWPPDSTAGNYCGDEAMVGSYQGRTSALAGHRDKWPRTAPVGSFPPNRLGLFDMGGNVWEWCATWYQSSMNTREVLEIYPDLNNDGNGNSLRVTRGGSWKEAERTQLRSDYRNPDDPRGRCSYFGFRVVLAGGG